MTNITSALYGVTLYGRKGKVIAKVTIDFHPTHQWLAELAAENGYPVGVNSSEWWSRKARICPSWDRARETLGWRSRIGCDYGKISYRVLEARG